MKALKELTGVAAPMPMINVDTDMIIPKQYLKTIGRSGLGKGLFHEMRYNEDGSDNPDFVLNKEAYKDARILVAGDNFGCGSSREHAAWAIEDFGIRCVIAPSFSDIFYNNAFKNGMLLIRLPQEEIDQLTEQAEYGSNAVFSIDLESQTVTTPNGQSHSFEIDEFRKHCLLNGLDEIALTLGKEDSISSFEENKNTTQRWLTPA
ncbi:3-isopropylmalate dehydratase small subunit [Chromatiales bacterium (ex Bugula neritina AB1)]|nr:3-isopropylmalate dehydratase small subunit [Chromatiales bacterium (ex Bugula neritina AB1)]